MSRCQFGGVFVICRQTLESLVEFVPQELDICDDIFVRPFSPCKIFGKRKKLRDQHGGEIGGWRFGKEVLEGNQVTIVK